MNTPTILMILFTAFLIAYSFVLAYRLDRMRHKYNKLMTRHNTAVDVFKQFVLDNKLAVLFGEFHSEVMKSKGDKDD